ncbi:MULTISPECIES: hypothetical protein [environmental samples]|uniref:hypothetical protein n=1 Tax=environmental samples TaxID=876090 RepID=UPI00033E0324|nr:MULTISPECIES: hypothetical protein [environmental samples]CDC68388.1 unknown [Oscillibacter sp. CAG:155]
MTGRNRALRFFALSLAGVLLALLLWRLSPGPEWLACSTAERYTRQCAPAYSHLTMVLEGEVSRHVVGSFCVEYPSWTVLLSQENDPDLQGPFLRLEMHNGIFPTAVTAASWWTPEISLPVSQ